MLWKSAFKRKRRKKVSVSSLTEKKSMGPELGTNLRPFVRIVLSGSVKGKSGGMVKTTQTFPIISLVICKPGFHEGHKHKHNDILKRSRHFMVG